MTEDSKQEPTIKVTDRRMFTADGKLREGFEQFDSDAAAPAPKAPEAPPAGAEPPAPGPARPEPEAAGKMPGGAGALGTPSFLELVGILADPIALYLGDAKLPDGGSAENLEAARFYIDLLDVLRTKTAGNLSPREESVLEDVLYQLRMRYVRKRR